MEKKDQQQKLVQGNDFQNFVIDDTVYQTYLTGKYRKRQNWEKPREDIVRAFIPGTIVKVYVKKGQEVKKGDKLMVLEAMKMKNKVLAGRNGKISALKIKEGDVVTKGQILIKFDS